ncbi:hypothetical protein GQ472_01160 [archaeon]|nr:hypothetical protein [archaeon]
MIKKGELIQLYTILHQLDHYFTRKEKYYSHDNPFFEYYESLNIPEIPVTVNKDKMEIAILTFLNGMATALDYVKNNDPEYGQNCNITEEPRTDTISANTVYKISEIIKTA